MPKEYIPREAAMPDGLCVGVSCQECPFCDDPIKGGCKVARFIDAIPAVAVITWAELKGLMVDKFKSRLAAGYTPTWNDAMEVVEELRSNGGQDDG